MTPHDYLVLGIAAFWLLTGWLGLTFTIRRIRRRETSLHGQQTPVYWH
jgi:hypothetical protein